MENSSSNTVTHDEFSSTVQPLILQTISSPTILINKDWNDDLIFSQQIHNDRANFLQRIWVESQNLSVLSHNEVVILS
jgi:hypothetical protein